METNEATKEVSGKTRVGYMFFGGPGVSQASRIARRTDPAKHPYLHLFVGHTDARHLNANFGGKTRGNLSRWLSLKEGNQPRLIVKTLGTTGNGSGSNPRVGREATKHSQEIIEKFIASVDFVILVGGLGGGTGTGALPLVAQWVAQVKKPGFAIVVIPFECDGPKRAQTAQWGLKKLLRHITTFEVQNEKVPNKELDDDEIFDQIDESCLYPMVWDMKRIIERVPSHMIVDISDLQNLCNLGRSGYYSRVEVGEKEPKPIDEVIKSLLEGNVYQRSVFDDQVTGAILLYDGRWLNSEKHAITKAITEKVSGECAGTLDIKTSSDIQRPKAVTLILVANRKQLQVASIQPVVKLTPTQNVSDLLVEIYIPARPLGNTKLVKVTEDLARQWRFVREDPDSSEYRKVAMMIDEQLKRTTSNGNHIKFFLPHHEAIVHPHAS